jgi:hypothetical protein
MLDSLGSRAEGSNPLRELEESLKAELGAWNLAGVDIDISPPSLSSVLEQGSGIFLDDGLRTPAVEKGHGLQRALIFALVRVWAKVLSRPESDDDAVASDTSISTVFAIEEPEIFFCIRTRKDDWQKICKESPKLTVSRSSSAPTLPTLWMLTTTDPSVSSRRERRRRGPPSGSVWTTSSMPPRGAQ